MFPPPPFLPLPLSPTLPPSLARSLYFVTVLLMSSKLEIILCCNAALKRLPITTRQSALTVELLNCQSGYQMRRVGVVCGEEGGYSRSNNDQ